MKLVSIAGFSILIVGCGMAQEERETLAQLTCNVMGESRNMDSVFRLKEINAAREKMEESAFLGTDDEIKDSFRLGLCKELVLSDAEYEEARLNVIAGQAERERREWLAIKEKQKVKAQETDKILEDFRKAVLNHIDNYSEDGFAPELTSLKWNSFVDNDPSIDANFTCYPDLEGELRLTLRNGFGTISASFSCRKRSDESKRFHFPITSPHSELTEKGHEFFREGTRLTRDWLRKEEKDRLSLDNLVESAEIIINSSAYLTENRSIDKSNLPHELRTHSLRPPITVELAIK